MNEDAFELEVPPLAEYLGTARSFVAAVARRSGAVGEAVEDLKLAASEACTDVMASGRTVRIRAISRDGALGFEIDAADRPSVAEGLDEIGAPARIDLVRALFPDAAVSDVGGRAVISFTLPLP